MRTVTWTLIGTTVFGVAWLALARTEEIVVATGKLEPIGSVQDIQMPVGGVVQEILVKEGQEVKAGQVLMKLDTEASKEQQKSSLRPRSRPFMKQSSTQGAKLNSSSETQENGATSHDE